MIVPLAYEFLGTQHNARAPGHHAYGKYIAAILRHDISHQEINIRRCISPLTLMRKAPRTQRIKARLHVGGGFHLHPPPIRRSRRLGGKSFPVPRDPSL